MEKKSSTELKILRAILWSYIILCIAIAGLNYGYASHADEKTAGFISWFWMFYENWIKTAFIIVCSFLTLRIVKKSGRNAMRKKNLIGIIVAALIVHIIMPIVFGNSELYFFAMPLPWTTTAFQLMSANSPFYISHFPLWGATGISVALIFYVCVNVIVFAGTLLLGRRWQCSTLCLFNGFAAEVFGPAIPLVGKKKEMNSRTLKVFSVLRWAFLAMALFFTIWWILFVSGVQVPGNALVIGKIEIFKYLIAELMVAMFFWVAMFGRGYCYYCPVGTVLGFISKIAGQKIKTGSTKCVQCGKCNEACPMSIDIKGPALDGREVVNLRCVGCGTLRRRLPDKDAFLFYGFSRQESETRFGFAGRNK